MNDSQGGRQRCAWEDRNEGFLLGQRIYVQSKVSTMSFFCSDIGIK